jgi:hypothetical protein
MELPGALALDMLFAGKHSKRSAAGLLDLSQKTYILPRSFSILGGKRDTATNLYSSEQYQILSLAT